MNPDVVERCTSYPTTPTSSLDAVHSNDTSPIPAVADNPVGLDGGSTSGSSGVNGVAMSASSSSAANARPYTRTSSINPSNHSPHTEFPPIFNGAPDVTTAPSSR